MEEEILINFFFLMIQNAPGIEKVKEVTGRRNSMCMGRGHEGVGGGH